MLLILAGIIQVAYYKNLFFFFFVFKVAHKFVEGLFMAATAASAACPLANDVEAATRVQEGNRSIRESLTICRTDL